MDRGQMAEFLRTRRAALQPEDVGMPRGRGRRTPGLRRDEVAALSGVSTDYYTRLEQPHGPTPSPQVLAALSRALRLTEDEQAHLFRLAGQALTPRGRHDTEPVSHGMLRTFDRLGDTPAMITDELGRTLAQTPLARALFGDERRFTGPARSRVYRWFTDPSARATSPVADHEHHGRVLVGRLAATASAQGPRSEAAALAADLRRRSEEFAALWAAHPVDGPYCEPVRVVHPRLGVLELHGDSLVDPGREHALTVFTAEPGTDSEAALARLRAESLALSDHG
ncbi:helix-turn-helix transcriptional regulator [Nocardioides sp. CER19]|uniref:helix-turn-helix transcriptional regulator n=1 Tax=Nocardioides sp. CER19 TaxID=3038538 RepID=UPI00244BD552|nr:helix-turn-helix transcriptional regulator [Nocardioides sp. CER19]MDH2414420.1 helix-turn-helix transcriptional regulator [Nocardioides sp. CER19]